MLLPAVQTGQHRPDDGGSIQAVPGHESCRGAALPKGVLDGHGLHGHRAGAGQQLRHRTEEAAGHLMLLGGDHCAAPAGGLGNRLGI